MVNNRQRFAAIRLVGLGTVTEQLGLSGVHTHTHCAHYCAAHCCARDSNSMHFDGGIHTCTALRS